MVQPFISKGAILETSTDTRHLIITDITQNIEEIKNKIESSLGLKVTISNKKNNSGKIVIKYKTLEQFELISKLLRK